MCPGHQQVEKQKNAKEAKEKEKNVGQKRTCYTSHQGTDFFFHG
jgi:hypothetical protein